VCQSIYLISKNRIIQFLVQSPIFNYRRATLIAGERYRKNPLCYHVNMMPSGIIMCSLQMWCPAHTDLIAAHYLLQVSWPLIFDPRKKITGRPRILPNFVEENVWWMARAQNLDTLQFFTHFLLLMLKVREAFCPRRRPHSGPIATPNTDFPAL